MRAQEQKTRQVPSALVQKFCLKINIAAYGEAQWLLVSLLSLSEIKPPADTQQDFLHFYAYIVYVK